MSVESLDALLVLAGEDEQTRPRTSHALRVYKRVSRKRSSPLPLVLSGNRSGLSGPRRPQAQGMRDFLIDAGVPHGHVFVEERSLDTYANMVLSAPVLDAIGARSVGLVTEEFHMPRSADLYFAVRGSAPCALPVPTGYDIKHVISEPLARYTLLADLSQHGVRAGCLDDHEWYLKEKHPFHAHSPPWTLYGEFVGLVERHWT